MSVFTRMSHGLDPEFAEQLMVPILQRDYHHYFEPLMEINTAHVVMLTETGILAPGDGALILKGLCLVREQLTADTLQPELDLYFNVENTLHRLVGAVAGWMHTGRSRNDLQATYQRMAVRHSVFKVLDSVARLRATLLKVGSEHVQSVMPGYTHTQPAQPITFGHYLLAVHDSFVRDWDRLFAAWQRVNHSPLGAGALASTGFPIDRQRTADLLGFDGLVENSLDAVASRDYLVEVVSACVTTAISASRLSTDLINWSGWEHRFVEIADGYASGSSIMPQKKNPLALEHTRAMVAHILATNVSLVTLTKGLPFTHSRDTGSESFRLAFDGLSETDLITRILASVVDTLTVDRKRMAAAADGGYSTATELADTLVRRCGLPFRAAHEIVGVMVARAVGEDRPAGDWTLADVQAVAGAMRVDISSLTVQDLRAALDPVLNVAARSVQGGPAPVEVQRMIDERRARHHNDQMTLGALRERRSEAKEVLDQRVKVLIGTLARD